MDERIEMDPEEERRQLARDVLECGTYSSCSVCPHSFGPPDAQECAKDVPVRALAAGMFLKR